MQRLVGGTVLGWLMAVPLAGQMTVTLSPATIPAVGQPGINSITLTGSNFPAGAILPENVIVSLNPVASNGTPATAQASSVTTVVGTTRRITFLLPPSLTVTVPSVYQASVSSSGPVSFSSGQSRATFTVNPPARLSALSPVSATVGQALSVSITGQYSRFVHGATQARFGPGIAVGTGPVGGWGPILVTSATSALAQIAIDPNTTPGPRNVDIQTGLELVSAPSSFQVTSGNPARLVTLSSTTMPAVAQPGEVVNVGATDLPAGNINAADITVYLNPAPGTVAAPRTTIGTGLQWPLGSAPVLLAFQIPAGTSFSEDTPFRISISGRTTAGVVFNSGNAAALTVAATLGQILTVNPASAAAGRTVALTVTGQRTGFLSGATQASLGAGIAVGGGPLGGFGPVVVVDANTIHMTVAIDAAAAPGPRTIVVRTGANQVSLPSGFSVLCSYGLAPTGRSFSPAGGTGSFVITTGAGCSWTASSDAAWITITSNPQGTGSGPVTFNVAAKSLTVARSGTITAGGQTFTVTQPACTYGLGASSALIPASGTSGAMAGVQAPAGCPWTASTSASWIHLRPGTESGSGPGSVIYDVDENRGSSQRTGVIAVEGLTFVVGQAFSPSTFSCGTAAVTTLVARIGGLTELMGDIVFVCSGSPVNADIQVSLNAAITSKAVGPPDGVDALVLLNDPATPAFGVNAFSGVLTGPGTILFEGVPLGQSTTVRITNVRTDTSVLPQQTLVLGDVTVTPRVAGVAPATYTGLRVAAAAGALVMAKLPAVSAAPLQTSIGLLGREGSAGDFKARIAATQDPSTPGVSYGTESGFVHTAALGAQVGTAASGTRLLARVGRVPSGVKVFAPIHPSGNSNARLTAQDSNGAGSGFVPGSPAFGGVYEEVMISNGAGSATWEITTSDPGAFETLRFDLVFVGATLAETNSIVVEMMLAPVGTAKPGAVVTVPLFTDPSGPRPR